MGIVQQIRDSFPGGAITGFSGAIRIGAGPLSHNDTLTSAAHQVTLDHGAGDDVLDVGSADSVNHVLIGGAGRDTLYAGGGIPLIP